MTQVVTFEMLLVRRLSALVARRLLFAAGRPALDHEGVYGLFALGVGAGQRVRVEPMFELFNLFNTANILGTTNVNYSGFSNVLVRDSDDPSSPGYLRSSSFGQPVTTAGGVFGSGGPRAMQLSARVTF